MFMKWSSRGKVAIILMLTAGGVFAQNANTAPGDRGAQVWQIPFASSDNTISLNIRNNSSIEAKNLSVTFSNVPSWFEFKSNTVVLKSVSPDSSAEAGFTFSVDRKAPVGKDTILRAVIRTSDGQSWTKEITMSVGAPRDCKLHPNFPNPFNPSTKIAFELPKASHVSLIIYDVLGREVAEIANQNYPAGYNEITWNGLNRNGEQVSSGVYFYRISTEKWSAVKKMMMLK
jgi:FlgD Ig-like domain